jgi:hypothetical protein
MVFLIPVASFGSSHVVDIVALTFPSLLSSTAGVAEPHALTAMMKASNRAWLCLERSVFWKFMARSPLT